MSLGFDILERGRCVDGLVGVRRDVVLLNTADLIVAALGFSIGWNEERNSSLLFGDGLSDSVSSQGNDLLSLSFGWAVLG